MIREGNGETRQSMHARSADQLITNGATFARESTLETEESLPRRRGISRQSRSVLQLGGNPPSIETSFIPLSTSGERQL